MQIWRSPHDAVLPESYRNKRNALLFAIFFSALGFALQVFGGIFTGSLALVGDTAHLFLDLVSLIVSLASAYFATLPLSKRFSFGFYRLEIMATFVNGVLLLVAVVWIAYEATVRLFHPQPIDAFSLTWIASLGLVLNLLSAFILAKSLKGEAPPCAHGGHEDAHHHTSHQEPSHRHSHSHDHGHDHLSPSPADHDHHSDMNMKSALAHLWSDAINSVAVIVGGVLVYFTKSYWIDSAIAFVAATLILFWSLRLIVKSAAVLLEGTPLHLDLQEISESISKMDPKVGEVEDIHIWSITSRMYLATLSLTYNTQSFIEAEKFRRRIEQSLMEKYGVAHSFVCVKPSISFD